jgi:cytochrome c-type biogenesis protein CcmH/NrfG
VTLSLDQLTELEEERRFLLSSLADLEREHAAGDVGEDDYRALKDGYTVRAADVLRALDAGRAPARRRASGDRRRTVVTVAVTVLVAELAGVLVVRYAAPRLPGVGPTGDLLDAVAAKLSVARQQQTEGDVQGAIVTYQDVLRTDPDNAEARTYLGWMIATTYLGQDVTVSTATTVQKANMTAAEALLDNAIRLQPDYADPKCFKAIVRFRFFEDAPGAKAAVDACLASNPPAVVAGLVARLRSDVDAALAAG